MGINYTALQTTARNLLMNNGQSLVFTRVSGGIFDPATGTTSGTTTSTITGVGVTLAYKSNEIDGEVIQRGDVLVIFEATEGAPAIDDTVSIDSVVYRVMDVEQVNPAGIAVIYKAQVRR